jgi:adenine deaminase
MNTFTISGQLIDLFKRTIYPAVIEVKEGIIKSITKVDNAPQQYILPGFIDAHVHIESSMLTPVEFARMACVHGTLATVSDPHEIANVCGIPGVQFMIDNSKQTPFKIFFGAPSCVPATSFETAGAVIDSKDIKELLQHPDIWYLTEMMNYPGVLHQDPEVMAKIQAAIDIGKPIDGHAPGLRGNDVVQYASAGITTDHECFTLDEAMDKVQAGMHILIREGSAAKNFEALIDIIRTHPEKVMFCSDDKHPDDLALHHINQLVKRALDKGYDLFDVLRAACINPVLHYELPVGLLRQGDPADFIIVNNTEQFDIISTYIDGQCVAKDGKTLLPYTNAAHINNFNTSPKNISDFVIPASEQGDEIRVIEAIEGQLVTEELILSGKRYNSHWIQDVEIDILKISVVNRYQPDVPLTSAFIKNFGLQRGAIASTVAHDCHNIVVVGAGDASMCAAVNALIDCKGGIAIAENATDVHTLPLPIAGLMTDAEGYSIAVKYAAMNAIAKQLGTTMHAPFMTLSFMALLVIPAIKLSDLGLFDGSKFQFTTVEV